MIDKRISKLAILILVSLLILTNVTAASLSSESSSSDEWRMFGRHLNHTQYTDSFAPPNISETATITYTGFSLYPYSTAAVANGTLYIAEVDNYFHALNASNISKVISKVSMYYSSDSPAIAGDYVYYNALWQHGTSNGYLYQRNASDISQNIASYYLSDQNNVFLGSPAVYDGSVYIGTYADYVFYQLNASDVSQSISITDLGWGVNCYSSPAVANGFVYVGCNDNKLYQLNATNASIIVATYTTGDDVDSSPAVTNEYVYVGSDDDKVYQLNASDVSLLVASYTTGGNVGASPGVAHGYVYIGSADNNFYQLNATNISLQVANYTGSNSFNTPAINDLYVFAGSGTNLYQFDAYDVSTLIGQVNSVQSSNVEGPIIAGGYVYIAGGTSSKLTQFGTSYPTTTLNSPINNFEFGYSLQNITFNCTASDSSGLVNVSLYMTNSNNQSFSLNQTVNISSQINSSNWTFELDEGNYTWNCLSFDTDGNFDWGSNRSMSSDTTPPTMTIDTPADNAFSMDNELDINYTVTEQNPDSCWYSNDSMTSNTSLDNCTTNIVSVTWSESPHNLTIWANDTIGNVGNISIPFTIDSSTPYFTNISNQTIEYGTALGYDINATDSVGINCFSVNDTGNFQINCSGFLENNTIPNISLYWLNITINDSSGNINWSSMWVNVSDTTPPNFTSISNQSIYDLDALGYSIIAADNHNVSCFGVNDSSFKINCSGYLENDTALAVGQYWLNITVNDTTQNENSEAMWVNVSLKPMIGLELVAPTININATQGALFNITLNVSCSRTDCGEINLSLYTIYENTSDVDVAFVCYYSGCSNSDDITDYLIGEGFTLTQNQYTAWTDNSLNTSAFDVMVVGGYYYVQDVAFNAASDIARDTFEDERMPTVIAADECDACQDMGITTTDGTIDGTQLTITNIGSHNIMTGYSGTVTIGPEDNDLGYYTSDLFNDDYTPLFEGEVAGRISGFAMDAGQATTGTDSGKFVWLGWDTEDSYPDTSGHDANITKQATCWAATGDYDCAPSRLINETAGTTPFYSNITNPNNVTLDENESVLITFWINATGTVNRDYEFFVDANKTSDESLSNVTQKWNITIIAAITDTTSPTIPNLTNPSPADNLNTTNTSWNFNWTITDETDVSLSCDLVINGLENGSDIVTPNATGANYTVNGFNDGSYVWNVTCSDDGSNSNTSETRTFTVDTSPPVITLDIPINDTWQRDGNVTFKYTPTDDRLDTCILYGNFNGSWTSNQSDSPITSGSQSTFNLNLTNGTYLWNIWCNDTFEYSTFNSTNLTFSIDNILPTIELNSPIQDFNSSSALVEFNWTAVDLDPRLTCNLTIDSLVNESLIESLNSSNSNITVTGFNEGTYLWNITCLDNATNINTSATRTFSVDIASPEIYFDTGTLNTSTHYSQDYILVNVSVTETNFKNITFFLYNTTSLVNETTHTTQTYMINFTNLIDNSYSINATIYDSSENYNFTPTRSSIVLDASSPAIEFVNPTPGNNTYKSETFVIINTTITETYLKDLKFNWNNTNYTMYNDSLVLMFNFDNVSAIGDNATYVVDVSNYGNNGTFEGDTYFNCTNNKYGCAVQFDGTGDYIDLGNPASLDVNEQTITAWLKTDVVDGNWHFAYGAGSTTWGVDYGISQGNKWATEFQNTDETWDLLEGSTPTAGQWMYLSFVYNGSNIYLYENGVLVDSGSMTGSMFASNTYYIGSKNNGGFKWDGTIDELRIWNRSLSTNEIYQQYVSNLNKYDTNKWNLYVNQSKNATNNLENGSYTYQVIASDIAGNTNSVEERTITVDKIPPTITLDLPLNNTWQKGGEITLSYTPTDPADIDSCILYGNFNRSWLSNQTDSSVSTGSQSSFTINLINGTYLWNVWCNDTAGNAAPNSTNLTFYIDTTLPTINLSGPINEYNTTSTSVEFNWTAIDNLDPSLTCNLTIDNKVNESLLESTNNTKINITLSGFNDGTYLWNITCIDNASNVNTSETRVFRVDIAPPSISLISPMNNSGDTDGNISLSYNVTDTSPIPNCSLIINDEINITNESITKLTTQTFNLYNLETNNYTWSVNCTDDTSQVGESEKRTVSAILTSEYLVLNLSRVNITNITNLFLKNNDFGLINFSESVDLSGNLDIDKYVNISNNRIEINSSALPQLNKSSTLYLYNLTFSNPRILRDEELCPITICTKLDYASRTLAFNVTQFSVYSAEETPVTPAEAASEAAAGTSQAGSGNRGILRCTPGVDCEEQEITEPEEGEVKPEPPQVTEPDKPEQPSKPAAKGAIIPYFSPAKYPTAYIVAALIISCIIASLFLTIPIKAVRRIRKHAWEDAKHIEYITKIKEKPSTEPLEKSISNLLRYIKELASKGIDKARIRRKLIISRWPRLIVDKTFEYIRTREKQFIKASEEQLPHLFSYITTLLHRGIDKQRIKKELIQAGWPKQAINKALKHPQTKEKPVIKIPEKPHVKPLHLTKPLEKQFIKASEKQLPSLSDYIKELRAKHVDKPSIRKKMVRAGWLPLIVDKAFKYIRARKKQVIKPLEKQFTKLSEKQLSSLSNYIKELTNNGIDKPSIIEKLIASGWPESAVDKAFEYLKTRKKQAIKPIEKPVTKSVEKHIIKVSETPYVKLSGKQFIKTKKTKEKQFTRALEKNTTKVSEKQLRGLSNYIKELSTRNIDKHIIIEKLIASGWPESAVDKAFEKLKTREIKTPQKAKAKPAIKVSEKQLSTLSAYIKELTSKGVDKSRIKKELIQSGWPESLVDQAFERIK